MVIPVICVAKGVHLYVFAVLDVTHLLYKCINIEKYVLNYAKIFVMNAYDYYIKA